ncbi:MAG: MYG1 family protein [Candidatus Pacearchaeota archaeon]|jgi:uncharacterized UPF0160 family protein
MKTVCTHDGRFHTDEVFAIAILKIFYKEIKIIRTRDEKVFRKTDLRVDIGRSYNAKTGDFDHHQNEFNLMRKNKIPYASAGLIWKHFGKKLVNSEKAFNYIDEKLIQPIDAIDSGVDITLKEIISNYGIGEITNSFLPVWYEEKNYDKSFKQVLGFASDLLKREIKLANGIEKAEEIVKKAISKSKNKDYIILEKNVPWRKYVIENTKIKFVVEPNSGGFWSVYTVRTKINNFEDRKSFPKKWADLQKEKLVKVTGVEDAMFCHKDLFTAVAKSREGAIKLAELAIKNKN